MPLKNMVLLKLKTIEKKKCVLTAFHIQCVQHLQRGGVDISFNVDHEYDHNTHVFVMFLLTLITVCVYSISSTFRIVYTHSFYSFLNVWNLSGIAYIESCYISKMHVMLTWSQLKNECMAVGN